MDRAPGASVKTMLARLALVAALLALVALLAFARRRRRARAYEPAMTRMPDAAFPAGSRAPLTAFYFTSRLCGACRETAGIVRDAAPEVPAVPLWVHERAGLARALGVDETPTLLLCDADGRIRYARAGNPTAEELWTYVREAWDSLDAEGRLARSPLTGSARTP